MQISNYFSCSFAMYKKYADCDKLGMPIRRNALVKKRKKGYNRQEWICADCLRRAFSYVVVDGTETT